MMKVRIGLVGFAIISLMISVGFGLSQSSSAQERRATEAPRSQTLSPRLQNQLERGEVEEAARVCGDACMSTPRRGGGMRLSAGGTTTADYSCNGGNCSCAGAVDCVAMAEICAPDTLGCNDYGCACKEGN